MVKDLFAEVTEEAVGIKHFDKTAVLTSMATTIVNSMLKEINGLEDETDKQFTADIISKIMKKDCEAHKAADDLLEKFANYELVDTEELSGMDDDTVSSMLKSQQSKRSKSKARADEYPMFKSMLVAAVAEYLLRKVYDKQKMSMGFGGARATVDWSDEGIEALADDQYALRAAIRNIQSKKTGEKKKPEFTEESERWQELLRIEAKLKSMRTVIKPVVNKNLEIAAVIDTIEDIDKAKAAELRTAINEIKRLLA